MRNIFIGIIFLLMLASVEMYGQKITFEVEKLTPPKKTLNEISPDSIFRSLIESDMGYSPFYTNSTINLPFNILAYSDSNNNLVNFGYHSFLHGMYVAYAQHRPFVLSPDMIWLLISQGFAQHIAANSDSLKKYFSFPASKLSLVVQNDNIDIFNPKSHWEQIFPSFQQQIAQYTGEDLINTLTCNFSTSTPTTKMASEITIMSGLYSYLEFLMVGRACGIPVITLEGTPDDWQKLYDKANSLRKYELDWWIDELDPILKEFIAASKGNVNKEFWTNMCKYHVPEMEYGIGYIIDGWIVKFFPYDKEGKRTNLKEIDDIGQMAPEIVKVDVQFVDNSRGKAMVIPLEFWAGFVGLKQDKSDFTLRPEIGWMIRIKDENNNAVKERIRLLGGDTVSFLAISVDKIPEPILDIQSIDQLNINFIDSIFIPQEMSEMEIRTLYLFGNISSNETKKICLMFPETMIHINGVGYNKAK